MRETLSRAASGRLVLLWEFDGGRSTASSPETAKANKQQQTEHSLRHQNQRSGLGSRKNNFHRHIPPFPYVAASSQGAWLRGAMRANP
jgi:hypothetical protein